MYRYLLIQILLLFSTSYAQDVQNFSLANDKFKYFSVDHADVLEKGEFNLNNSLNYGKNPLILTNPKQYLVDQITTYQIAGAYGILDNKFQLNFDFGYGFSTGKKPNALDSGSGFNNFKIASKIKLYDQNKLKISLILPLAIPLKDTKTLGASSFLVSFKSIASYQIKPTFNVSINLGYRYRLNKSNEYSLDDAILYGIGSQYKLTDDFMLKGEVFGRYFFMDNINPLEFLLGAKRNEKSWFIELALGRGITSDYSSVNFRFLFNFGLLYGVDTDKDGLSDSVDQCPNTPEDKDEHLDEDGCPDMDNDKDGILDVVDKCINEPEDKDNFQDEDGCSDLDNDNDNLSDALDQCPYFAEIINGIEDHDGCPDGVSKTIDSLDAKNEIYFEKDKSTIMPMSYPFIYELAQIINKNDAITEIVIEATSQNLQIAFDRGDAVKKSLKSLNVKANLVIKGIEGAEEKIEFKVMMKTKVLLLSP
jgi:outer membrane protein OmpA-like peptidoglycan-associated protein/opacity protein-like surface antigen